MKVVRIFVFSLITIAALIGVAIVFAFMPSVQTWAAKRALAKMPDAHGEISRVEAGLHRITLNQLVYEKQGLRLTVPSLTIEIPVMRAAKRDVAIQNVVSKGWILDLTAGQSLEPSTPKSAAVSANAITEPPNSAQDTSRDTRSDKEVAAGKGFAGVFDLLRLPVDLQVEHAELEGDVLSAARPGEAPSRTHVVISGGGLGSGKSGKFRVESATRISRPDAAVSELTTTSDIVVEMDTPRTFHLISSTSDVAARGSKITNGTNLRLVVGAEGSAQSENYQIRLNSNSAGTAGKQLAAAQASFQKTNRTLSGTWTLDARDADLAPFALGQTLPEFNAVGSGNFQMSSNFDELRASGKFNADIAKIEHVYPGIALPMPGPLRTQGEFDLVQQKNVVRIDRFTASVASEKPLVTVEALQPIEFDTDTKAVTVADAKQDLFRARLNGIPLAYLKSFLPSDLALSGSDVTGEVVAAAIKDVVEIKTVTPLTLGELTIKQADTPILERVTLRAELTGQYGPQGWQANVAELTLTSDQNAWLKAAMKVGRATSPDGANAAPIQPLKAAGQYELHLSQAGKQPVLKTLSRLTAGRASGDFTLVLTDALSQIASKFEVRELAAPGVAQPVPNLDVNLRADIQPDGLIKLQAPIVVQKGDRKSDLDAVAELRSNASKLAIDAHVRSQLLYVEDLQALAAPLASSENAKSASTPPPASSGAQRTNTPASSSSTPSSQKPDTKPFWSDLSGQIQLELKKVIYSTDLEAANVTGSLKVGPDAIALENLNAVMGEGSSAKVTGGLAFNSKSKDPYSLDANVNVANVNPGPILALLNPSKQPTVEGPFDLVGKFSGEAATVDSIAESTSAELKLTSRGGKFRGFAASSKSTDIAKYQKTVSTVGSILNMAGGLLGSNASSAYGEKITAASDTLKRLLEIDFDQLNLELSHRPGEDLKVTDFSLISPDLRLVSSGSVNTETVMRWWEKPLHLDVQMAVRGEQAKNLAKLNLLKESKDPLGYIPLLEKFTVDGTMANFGADTLSKLVTRAFATSK